MDATGSITRERTFILTRHPFRWIREEHFSEVLGDLAEIDWDGYKAISGE